MNDKPGARAVKKIGKLTYLKGDATAPQTTRNAIIAHCTNDKGGWGAGFVLALSAKWRTPEADYKWTARTGRLALGTVRVGRVAPNIWVANMCGQTLGYGPNNEPPVRYDAIEKCLTILAKRARDRRADIHAPRFGAGLAGGDFRIIEKLIEKCLLAEGVDVFIYDYDVPPQPPRRQYVPQPFVPTASPQLVQGDLFQQSRADDAPKATRNVFGDLKLKQINQRFDDALGGW
jgi:hypothetical protein